MEDEEEIPFNPDYQQGYTEGWGAAFAACAEIVRAQPCTCMHLGGYEVKGGNGEDWQEVIRHNAACPDAMLAAIEARGKEGR